MKVFLKENGPLILVFLWFFPTIDRWKKDRPLGGKENARSVGNGDRFREGFGGKLSAAQKQELLTGKANHQLRSLPV